MTLSPTERAVLRQQWLAQINAEIKRRQAQALGAVGGDPRKEFLDRLAEIRDRLLRSSPPGLASLTPDQERRARQQLDRWFKQHGYGTEPGE